MPKWEYRIVRMGYETYRNTDIEQFLNDRGSNNWELVTVEIHGESAHSESVTHVFYFKKPGGDNG